MLSLKTNGLDNHAKGMSLHLGYFDTAPCPFIFIKNKNFRDTTALYPYNSVIKTS